VLTFCTIVTPATAAPARVMGESVRAHHSDARLIAWASEAVSSRFLEPFETVDAPLAGSIPDLMRHVLAEPDSGPAVYLAPTVAVYAPLTPLADAGSPVVLVRRLSQLPDDGERPDDADLIEAGRISTAGLAVDGSVDGDAFLRWWTRARQQAAERAEGPVDGRLLEQGASRFAGAVTVLDDPGLGVGYWNLHERPLAQTARGLTAGGAPLRSFAFEGFRGDRPYWLSDGATRVRVIGDPLLAELCGEYGERLRAAGWTPPPADIVDLVRLGNGQRIDDYVRRLWRDAREQGEEFGDPGHPEAADAFVAWMQAPGRRGAAAGVNRYLFEVYRARPDLQREFPQLDEGDGTRLVDWAWGQYGREALAEMVPIPLGEVRAGPADRIAVNVIGYLGETFGLAEVARLYVRALQTARIPVTTRTLRPDLPIDSDQRHLERPAAVGWEELHASAAPVFNLACINGDHLVDALRREGGELLGGRPTIGQWGWETDVIPPSWEGAIPHLDEVWVYSRFMAENLGRLLPVPVVVVPPPIPTPEPGLLPAGLIDDERFTFVFMVDLFSTLERKNPGGLVEAFTRAFAESDDPSRPQLLIKTINARFRPEALDELRSLAGGRADVVFTDVMLDDGAKTALLHRADCYVSLHRSEGFGLPLAEAMALGTPVIATGYSGNTDFMTPANSLLVDWTETRVGPGSRVYPAHGRWAEPDLDHAAALMREVWEHPERAGARAARARADIEGRYSPAAVGQIARARLERLAEDRTADAPGRPLGRTDLPLAAVEQALAVDPGAGSGGPAGAARRLVLRLIRPFTYHERAVDRAMLEALRSLQEDVRRRDRN
jgi:glycosyltransferase involved in cell wall biosynthesis